MKVFKPTGMSPLGAYTHGEKGETHYIYMMYKDQAAMLGFGPKTEAEAQHLRNFSLKQCQYLIIMDQELQFQLKLGINS